MSKQEANAYPVSKYRFMKSPERADLVILELVTENGANHYVFNREALEQFSQVLTKKAAEMAPSQ
jgi:hypothetical protein